MKTETQELVYAVTGGTGAYSDHREWIVAAFYNENDANEYCRLCKVEADIAFNLGNGYSTRALNKYDSQFDCDFTGTHYHVQAINLFNFLPS